MSNKMFSVVIRNKNEASALENVLHILTKIYASDIQEIILVDNNSTDNSVEIANKFHCKVVTIDQFTYGKAINVGIAASESRYVLLLSSHAIPIGNSFFKNALKMLSETENIAGARFINSIENYNRAINNNFKVAEPLTAGLMAACCVINKNVWAQFKFDENLVAIEDKEWSQRVSEAGFEILDINESYFYFIRRSEKASLNRYKNETLASHQLTGKSFPGPFLLLGYLLKKLIVTNTKNYFKAILYDISTLKAKLEISNKLKKNGKNR